MRSVQPAPTRQLPSPTRQLPATVYPQTQIVVIPLPFSSSLLYPQGHSHLPFSFAGLRNIFPCICYQEEPQHDLRNKSAGYPDGNDKTNINKRLRDACDPKLLKAKASLVLDGAAFGTTKCLVEVDVPSENVFIPNHHEFCRMASTAKKDPELDRVRLTERSLNGFLQVVPAVPSLHA